MEVLGPFEHTSQNAVAAVEQDGVLLPLNPSVSQFWDVHAFGSTQSTNVVVKDALRKGAAEGFCATALEQSGGYGRQGRAWASPQGGLYTSFALRPNVQPQTLPTLSLVVSLAIADALEAVQSACHALIKWPNDVLCTEGKLAGISLEALAGGVCVGVGINVFRPACERPVSGKYRLAYLEEGCAQPGLSESQRGVMTCLVQEMLSAVEARYLVWCEQGFSAFIEEYEARFAYRNKRVSLQLIDGTQTIEGVIRGVDELGRLLVEVDDGTLTPMSSGEVHVTAFDA